MLRYLFGIFYKKKKCRIRFSPRAAKTYDQLLTNEDARIPRIRKTLGFLEVGKLRARGLKHRRWRRGGAYNSRVFETFISQSEPDFLIIWHYFHEEEIVVLLIALL